MGLSDLSDSMGHCYVLKARTQNVKDQHVCHNFDFTAYFTLTAHIKNNCVNLTLLFS